MPAVSFTLNDVVRCLKDAGLLVDQKGSFQRLESLNYTTDTRTFQDGQLFIAYRGVSFDSHARVPELARQYPKAMFLIEEPKCFELLGTDNPVLLVSDSRDAWSHIAAMRYGNPQTKLKLIGVTGTNGKTSTVWFIRQIMLARQIPCMTMGTLGIYCGDEMLPATHTTPDPDDLFNNLAMAVTRGVTWVAMEVSSHSITQRRLGPLLFDAVAFTSFSRDHLDFHATMKEYFAAKWELFSRYRKPNAPGWVSTTLCEQKILPKKHAHFGLYGKNDPSGEKANYRYTISESRLNHTHLTLHSPRMSYELAFNFGGDFVMDNFTAAFALVDSLDHIQTFGGDGILPVPGRFEPVPSAAAFDFAVIVDYAHTPDALEKTLQKLKEMTTGRLWVVFGCGGDRDSGKRPLMGAIADKIADYLVITSDNPRTEMPGEIVKQILSGIVRKKNIEVIEDRLEAITYACHHAQASDSVLIAGKGHEDYQILGKTKFPFDDRLVAAESLRSRQ
ncbi:MAG: UDP-N-acetylmuramoyl-L-alanyl-D-glutamate--2,6-diaminopimelate ligase [Chitinophagaceae bacterium]|nr:UDP-N-acetylmuramoyl-L-alanyl-D-glutamate--2,6-diaminopimelate ligase [Oligoflexus sp.]